MSLRAACLLLSLGLVPTLASAQDNTDDRREEAQMLFGAGMSAYEAERYEDALDHFRRSYDLVPDRAILFNVARSAERAEHHREALGYYRQLAAGATEPGERDDLEAAIARVSPLAEAEETEHAVDPAGRELRQPSAADAQADPGDVEGHSEGQAGHVAQAPTPSDAADPTGWILVGAGGAVLVAAVVLLAIGISDAGAINAVRDGAARWEDIAGDVDRAHGFQVGGGIGVGIGLGIVGAGIGALAGGDTSRAALRLRLTGQF